MISALEMIRAHRRGAARYGAAGLLLALIAWGELGRIGGAGGVMWWADGGWTLCAAIALAACLVAARRGGPGRRAWLFFSGGCATWLCGELAWNYYQLVAHIPPPFPSWGDAGWLGFVPWFAAGIFTLPRGNARQKGAGFFVLDFAIVALAISLIGDIAGQDALAASTAVSDWGKATAMAYPVGYLTLTFGVLLLMMRVPGLAATRGMPALLAGLLCESAGFVAWTPLLLTNTYQDGTALDLVWMAGLLAIGLAGLEWRAPRTPVSERDHARPLVLVLLGSIPTILGTGVVLATPLLDEGPLQVPMEIGSGGLIILIALRQFAAVLENTRLYRAEAAQRDLAQRRADRLRRVQELGQTLRLDLDPASIGRHIVDAARVDLGYRAAVLNLIDDPAAPLPEQRVRVVATTGLEPEVAARFLAHAAPASDIFRLLRAEFRLSRSFFLPAESAASLEATAIPIWTPPLIPASPRDWQADDALFVPLIAPRTTRFLGFLSVDDPVDGRRPDAETVEVLEIFADHAALAIENARLYVEARRRTSRSEAVGDLLHALGHHLEVDAVLRTGVDGLVRLTGADSAALCDYDSARHALIKRAGVGAALEDGPIGGVFSLDDEPHAAHALQRRAIVAYTAPETHAEAQIWARLGCRAVLVAPLLSAGEPRGIVYINYRDTRLPTSEEELRFIQDIADALAVALEKASLYERTRAQAMRDPVTDLANHRAVHQALDAALAAPVGQPAPRAALLLLDVDNFKLFNDTYGHPTGDAVLRAVADHLRACSREGDVAGRYGGDEFAVVLPGADHAGAEEVARRLTRAVVAAPYVAESGAIIPLSISIGVAAAPADGQTRQALLAVADARMYAAKHGSGADAALLRSTGDLLGETTFGILEGMVAAVDAKDRYTREHSLDVTRYALMLAGALGLSEAEQRTLAVAGPLHDIGKIAVPDRVLRKPSALTKEEYEIIKTHVTYSVAIVSGILDDPAVLDAIAHHHERYDGRGYPQGMHGEQTPLLGRIMQVADAVSAMTLDRPYRRGLDAAHVIIELRAGAGAQFDPALVETFISAFTAERAPSGAVADQLPTPISQLRAS